MIKLSNVSYRYSDGTHALHDINLEINDGEFVYITGTTGSGKSTLIKLLDTEVVPTKGTVEVNGVNVGKLRYSKVPLYRRTIGVVFQEYRLLEKKTVFENIAFALEAVDTPKVKLRKRVREVLKLVDLSDKYSSMAKKISGGQQQRTAIARAIANKPKILIADEPTGNLDPTTSDEIISLFEKINKEEGTTILIVTHDADVVRNHPKRTIKIEQGHIVDDRFGATIDDIAKAEMEETQQLELTRQEQIIKEEEESAKKIEAEYNV
ncbi:MAG: cell division ATP-binding protein FtsE [Erysipelotrichaceae bacterium]|nr:cell division ATP-binding protein FtsE [Erysipelotrichaceae bacterium]